MAEINLKIHSKTIRKSVIIAIDEFSFLSELVSKIQSAFRGQDELDELFDETHWFCFFTHLKKSENRLNYEGNLITKIKYKDYPRNNGMKRNAMIVSCRTALPEIKSKLLFVFDYFGGPHLEFIITRQS